MVRIPTTVQRSIAEQIGAENLAIKQLHIRGGAAQKKSLAALKRGENHFAFNVKGVLDSAIRKATLLGIKRTISRLEANTKISFGIPVNFDLYSQVLKISDAYINLDVRALIETQQAFGLQALNEENIRFEHTIRKQIGNVLEGGSHVGQQKASLLEAFQSAGVSKRLQTPGRLETIARTQVSNAYNAARWKAVEEHPDIADLVWGYKYVAIDDTRVRARHLAQDGNQVKKEDPYWDIWWPPNGYNCRCSTIEIFRSEKPRTIKRGMKNEPDPGFLYNAGQVV